MPRAHAVAMTSSQLQATRTSSVMTRDEHGQPRTLRLVHNPSSEAAYRRLAVAILGLDVVTLAASLGRPDQRAA